MPRPLQGTPLSPEIYGTDVCKWHNRKINLILCVLMGVCWCFYERKWEWLWAWLTYCSLRLPRQPHSNTPRTSTWQPWQLAPLDLQTRQILEREGERGERDMLTKQFTACPGAGHRKTIRLDRLAASVNLIKL